MNRVNRITLNTVSVCEVAHFINDRSKDGISVFSPFFDGRNGTICLINGLEKAPILKKTPSTESALVLGDLKTK